MKKVFIFILVITVVLIGVSQIPAVKKFFSQEKAIKEAIAAKLNVPVDSVVVNMDKAETYDRHILENLTALDTDEMVGTVKVQEEKSGKFFLVTYKGLEFSVEFAPGEEAVTEDAPVAEEATEAPAEEAVAQN